MSFRSLAVIVLLASASVAHAQPGCLPSIFAPDLHPGDTGSGGMTYRINPTVTELLYPFTLVPYDMGNGEATVHILQQVGPEDKRVRIWERVTSIALVSFTYENPFAYQNANGIWMVRTANWQERRLHDIFSLVGYTTHRTATGSEKIYPDMPVTRSHEFNGSFSRPLQFTDTWNFAVWAPEGLLYPITASATIRLCGPNIRRVL